LCVSKTIITAQGVRMDLYKAYKQLKQFSGYKPSSLYGSSRNISGISVVVAYKKVTISISSNK
jgi:hypothetical protein